MRIRPTLAIPLLALAVAAFAQDQPASQPSGRSGARQGKPPKSATHNGHPALEYEGFQGWAGYVEYFVRQGEPALGFSMAQPQCPGHVYVTRTRISGDFQGTSCDSFDLARSEATADRQEGKVTLTAGASSYSLTPMVERGDDRRPAPRMGATSEVLVRAVRNFDGVYANLRRLGMAQAQPAGDAVQPAADTADLKQPRDNRALLDLTSDPGDVQVYINDEPRGMTSAEGHEVLRLPAGKYRLRLSLPGYKDFVQDLTLAAGQKQGVTARLETVGPPPFAAGDIADMLKGKVSPLRIASLVRDRGVDFDLNPDLEKRLRTLGANQDLLLAIATSKKK